MSEGKEYGEKILKRILDAVYAGREKLADRDSYIMQKYLQQNGGNLAAAQEDLIASKDFEDFIFEQLSAETTELMREIFSADHHGAHYAGFVTDVLNTREEYAEKEEKQVNTFYRDLSDTIAVRKRANQTIQDFYKFMDEAVE